ncbi:MAG: nickel-dependent hydrogenase large subunit [Candidatus Bathyarchaeia archaeon]
MTETVFTVPVGPQHPALKEPENLMISVDGELVVDVRIRLGYVHRGGEKAFESRNYNQGLYLVERICGICAMAHQLCYANNVEALLGVSVPRRADYIRTIIAELERMHSHLLWVGVAGHEVGWDTLFMYTWRDREAVLDLMELATGNRVLHATNAIGGVRRDLTPEVISKIAKGMRHLEDRVKYYASIIPKERTIMKRAVGVGILKPRDAVAFCAVGPTLRASGIKRDVRRDDPYSAYDEIPFEVVTHDGCDVAARVLVRIGELAESIRIVNYALEHLPSGPIRVRVPINVPAGENVSLVEAPRGEDIHYCRSNGTDKPERYKVRAPTLANWASMAEMLKGGYVADIPIVLAAIDPCMSCTDRMAFTDVNSKKKWYWTIEDLRRQPSRWHGK